MVSPSVGPSTPDDFGLSSEIDWSVNLLVLDTFWAAQCKAGVEAGRGERQVQST